jgi:AraC-like DNA-binding protein
MDSRLFELDLPEDTVRQIIEKAEGMRLSIPRKTSQSNRFFREDRNKRLCRAAIEIKDIKEIAYQFNLSTRQTRRILSENGLTFQADRKKSRREQLVELLACNYTRKRIAEMLGISRQRLYQILNEEGLK